MTRRRLRVWFDGGCRPNPGPIEVAVVARGVTYLFDDLGCGSSSDAEWLALHKAVEVAQQSGETGYELIGDCKAVIEQASGKTSCRSVAAQAHHARFLALAAKSPPARLRWTGRHQNLAGIALAARHER